MPPPYFLRTPKMLLCYNKILLNTIPAHQVVSPSKLRWIETMVRESKFGMYEEMFYMYYFKKENE